MAPAELKPKHLKLSEPSATSADQCGARSRLISMYMYLFKKGSMCVCVCEVYVCHKQANVIVCRGKGKGEKSIKKGFDPQPDFWIRAWLRGYWTLDASPHLLPMHTINRMLSELLQVPLPLPPNQPGLMEQTRYHPFHPSQFLFKTNTYIDLLHTFRGIPEKGSGDVVSAVCYTIHTIYLSLCTQTAETKSPESFSRIALYIIWF